MDAAINVTNKELAEFFVQTVMSQYNSALLPLFQAITTYGLANVRNAFLQYDVELFYQCYGGENKELLFNNFTLSHFVFMKWDFRTFKRLFKFDTVALIRKANLSIDWILQNDPLILKGGVITVAELVDLGFEGKHILQMDLYWKEFVQQFIFPELEDICRIQIASEEQLDIIIHYYRWNMTNISETLNLQTSSQQQMLRDYLRGAFVS